MTELMRLNTRLVTLSDDFHVQISTMNTAQASYEKRFDAITKTFMAEIRDVVKFEEDKVRSTQAAAYKAVLSQSGR